MACLNVVLGAASREEFISVELENGGFWNRNPIGVVFFLHIK